MNSISAPGLASSHQQSMDWSQLSTLHQASMTRVTLPPITYHPQDNLAMPPPISYHPHDTGHATTNFTSSAWQGSCHQYHTIYMTRVMLLPMPYCLHDTSHATSNAIPSAWHESCYLQCRTVCMTRAMLPIPNHLHDTSHATSNAVPSAAWHESCFHQCHTICMTGVMPSWEPLTKNTIRSLQCCRKRQRVQPIHTNNYRCKPAVSVTGLGCGHPSPCQQPRDWDHSILLIK